MSDQNSIETDVLAQARAIYRSSIAESVLLKVQIAALTRKLEAVDVLANECCGVIAKLTSNTSQQLGKVRRPRNFNYGDVRGRVLSVLAAAPPDGLTAEDVRQQVAISMGPGIHPKTPGMTLTRLKQSGHATRVGRRWKLAHVRQS